MGAKVIKSHLASANKIYTENGRNGENATSASSSGDMKKTSGVVKTEEGEVGPENEGISMRMAEYEEGDAQVNSGQTYQIQPARTHGGYRAR